MRIDADEVRRQAKGRWDQILVALAPKLEPAVKAMGRKHVPCPVHGGRDGLRTFRDVADSGGVVCNTCGIRADGFATLMWINDWDFLATLEAVAEYLHVGKATQALSRPSPVMVDDQASDERKRQILNRIWNESVTIEDRIAEPARLYLARRGITVKAPAALRFHPSLGYFDGSKLEGCYPAIVMMVHGSDGSPVTIHRIYLTREGMKAPVESPKKMMSYPSSRDVTGGAIRIVGPGPVMAVAEGVETALAVMEGTGLPVWCGINAYLLENMVLPDDTERVIVFADKDRPSPQHPKGHGQEAARALVLRLWELGIQASAIVPPGVIPEGQKSLDWLDILRRDGKAGFPTIRSVQQALRRVA